MVSKAKEDFPLPLNPVITTSFSRGILTSMFFKLCTLAPKTSMYSCCFKFVFFVEKAKLHNLDLFSGGSERQINIKYYLAITIGIYGFYTCCSALFERHGFAVSTRLADRLGMRVTNVRLFFIYISFVTVGLSFALYLTLAFVLRLKDVLYVKRSSVFDL